MRTTLDIADDVLQAAKELARRDKKSVGHTLSELARAALTQAAAPRRGKAQSELYGFRPFPSRGGVVTNALIDKLREDDAP